MFRKIKQLLGNRTEYNIPPDLQNTLDEAFTDAVNHGVGFIVMHPNGDLTCIKPAHFSEHPDDTVPVSLH